MTAGDIKAYLLKRMSCEIPKFLDIVEAQSKDQGKILFVRQKDILHLQKQTQI
jgi:hypothetical protein